MEMPGAMRLKAWNAARVLKIPLFVRPRPARRVVMFHIGRSGSSVLGRMIRRHPFVLWKGEILRPQSIRKSKAKTAEELIRRYVRRARGLHFGFEVKFFHLADVDVTLDAFLTQLDAMRFTHFVILRRRNLLRLVTSAKILVHHGRGRLRPGAEPSVRQVPIDPALPNLDRLDLSLADSFDRWDGLFSDVERALADRPLLKLWYEDHIEADPRVAYDEMCAFLGIPPIDVDVGMRRVNPFPLREMIENYDEVAAALRPTRHAWMLEE